MIIFHNVAMDECMLVFKLSQAEIHRGHMQYYTKLLRVRTYK